MLKVISNTTPILSLLKIGKLDLLQKLYGEITIPEAVYSEIEVGKEKSYYVDLKSIAWINIEKIDTSETKLYLFDLDDGEAEVVILAREQNADLVILDEIIGRNYAKQLNLKLTGTLGILLKAKKKGFIDKILPLLNELTQKGSWINPKLMMQIVKIAGESF
jgi:predicted nucleic acid-binding protein